MNPLKCPLCCKCNFDSVLALQSHLIFHVSQRIKCPCCDFFSDGILDLINHLKLHLGDGSYSGRGETSSVGYEKGLNLKSKQSFIEECKTENSGRINFESTFYQPDTNSHKSERESTFSNVLDLEKLTSEDPRIQARDDAAKVEKTPTTVVHGVLSNRDATKLDSFSNEKLIVDSPPVTLPSVFKEEHILVEDYPQENFQVKPSASSASNVYRSEGHVIPKKATPAAMHGIEFKGEENHCSSHEDFKYSSSQPLLPINKRSQAKSSNNLETATTEDPQEVRTNLDDNKPFTPTVDIEKEISLPRTPKNDTGSSTGDHPYIHKKFDHDLERKIPQKTHIKAKIQSSLQSFLIRKLNFNQSSETFIPSTPNQEELSDDDSVPVIVGGRENNPDQVDSKERAQHDLIHSQEKRSYQKDHRCKHCTKVYTKKALLKRHYDEKHSDRIYPCSYCEKKFSSKRNLENHLYIHSGKMFNCSQCSYTCLTSSGLRSHLFQVHSNKPRERIRCHICQEEFRKKYGLERHMQRKHKVDGEACKYCDRRFSCKEDLNRHLTVHTNPDSLTCDICNILCTSLWSLKRHKDTVHARSKVFRCGLCDTSFTRRDSLLDHEKLVHSQSKPFKCSWCKMAFYLKAHLKAHEVKHSIGQHKCKLCNKLYKYKDSLKKHNCKNQV